MEHEIQALIEQDIYKDFDYMFPEFEGGDKLVMLVRGAAWHLMTNDFVVFLKPHGEHVAYNNDWQMLPSTTTMDIHKGYIKLTALTTNGLHTVIPTNVEYVRYYIYNFPRHRKTYMAFIGAIVKREMYKL